MSLSGPIFCIRKGGYQFSICFFFNSPTDMIKMKMCDQHISDRFRCISGIVKGGDQRRISMKEIMTKKPFILFISKTRIDKDYFFTCIYEETTHSPTAKIVIICRDHFVPDGFGY